MLSRLRLRFLSRLIPITHKSLTHCVRDANGRAGDKIVEKRLCRRCATLRRTSERERKDWICRRRCRRLRRSSDHAIIYQDEIEEGREERAEAEGAEVPFTFIASSVSQRVLQLVSHDDVDRLVQGSVQREAVLLSPKFSCYRLRSNPIQALGVHNGCSINTDGKLKNSLTKYFG